MTAVRRCCVLFGYVVLIFSGAECRADSVGPWSLDELTPSPRFEWVNSASPVRSLTYQGLPYKGAPTEVFAYYANPATLAGEDAPAGQYPGIVLIHGGGGTAFKTWVELWAKRGYAAIAMDLAGSRPDEDDPKQRTRLEHGGPPQDDDSKFESIRTDDTSDDWPLHAVANSILAHSLLRGFREVNEDRTAVTGISWGGYTSCLVASIDSRFKAAAPVYGCGYLHENSSWLPQFAKLGPDLTKKWVQLYDPSTYLPHCHVPLFFVNGTSDKHYRLDSYNKTLRAAGPAVKNVRITVEMPHSHEAGWAPEEIGLFVDSQLGVNDTKPLPGCGVATDDLGRVVANADAETEIRSAELHFAKPGGRPINERAWQTLPATVRGKRVTAEWLPPDADLFFFTLTDERGAIVSSKVSIRDPISIFDVPAMNEAQTRVMMQFAQLAAARNYAVAEQLLANAIRERRLNNAINRYNLACSLALLGRSDEALEHLAASVGFGWSDVDHTEHDADLDSLRDLPRYKELIEQMKSRPPVEPQNNLQPFPVKDGVGMVEETNTTWAPQFTELVSAFQMPEADPAAKICTSDDAVGKLLREWQQEGTAAGLQGWLYDNHDRDHSNMDYENFPQLTRVEFCEAARQRNLDMGPQRIFLYSAPTIGNSSTANTGGPFWGSQTRNILRDPRSTAIASLQYVANHLYFYPEHRDHDIDGFGDVFHANTPYVITSQGSSYTDKPFMHAVACTIAALQPETQQALLHDKLMMPTVQMLFRSSLKTLKSPEDYLTGRAHPTVFDEAALDAEKMVRAAHDLRSDEYPPLIRLKVMDEDEARLGVDYCDVGIGEKIFDTVSAISRVFRTSAWQKQMVVSVEETKDPHDRPLTFEWRLLRGDPERVTITPLNEAGTQAQIQVAWHERRPVEPGSKLLSARVDIGVFAHNGVHYSAPGFISYFCPPCEKRVYDAEHRIVSIEHVAGQDAEHYSDPMLMTPGIWKDVFHYDAEGHPLGWTRTQKDSTSEFTQFGTLVVDKDDQGRPMKSQGVIYLRQQANPQSWPELHEQPIPRFLLHKYASPEDRVGEVEGIDNTAI